MSVVIIYLLRDLFRKSNTRMRNRAHQRRTLRNWRRAERKHPGIIQRSAYTHIGDDDKDG